MAISVYIVGQLRMAGLPDPVEEYRFAPPRRWRFDLAWPDPAIKLAVEIEGGVWTGGRHTRPSGYLKDIEKYNQAAIMGWRLVRITPAMVKSGEALALIERALTQEV
jgi:hypothetical protein